MAERYKEKRNLQWLLAYQIHRERTASLFGAYSLSGIAGVKSAFSSLNFIITSEIAGVIKKILRTSSPLQSRGVIFSGLAHVNTDLVEWKSHTRAMRIRRAQQDKSTL